MEIVLGLSLVGLDVMLLQVGLVDKVLPCPPDEFEVVARSGCGGWAKIGFLEGLLSREVMSLG